MDDTGFRARMGGGGVPPSRIVLPNGLPVIAVELPHLHTAALCLLVRVGSRHETRATNGVSHFLEHMLFRGTKSHPTAYDLNHAIECLGSTMDAATSRDSTELSVRVFPDAIDASLELLAEIVQTGRFTDIEVERRVILEEIADEVDEDGRLVDLDQVAKVSLWPESPLGFPIAGPPSNVERFGVADLVAHRDRFYVASNAVLAVAGPVAAADVHRMAELRLGGLPSGVASVDLPPELGRKLPALKVVQDSGSQTDVQLAFLAPPESDPDGVALQVLLRILDDGVAARLQRRLCDELGLAYHVGASLESYRDVGLLLVEGAVRHEKVPALLDGLGGVLAELRERPVDDQELHRARMRYRFSLSQRLDSPEAMATWVADRELLGSREPFERRMERVERVTSEDVTRVARRVLRPENLLVTAVGHLGRGLLARTKESQGRLCTLLDRV